MLLTGSPPLAVHLMTMGITMHAQVLKRINSEIEARRKAGEDLPPPPKTAIAGPEYFGLNQPEVISFLTQADTSGQCTHVLVQVHVFESAGSCADSTHGRSQVLLKRLVMVHVDLPWRLSLPAAPHETL